MVGVWLDVNQYLASTNLKLWTEAHRHFLDPVSEEVGCAPQRLGSLARILNRRTLPPQKRSVLTPRPAMILTRGLFRKNVTYLMKDMVSLLAFLSP